MEQLCSKAKGLTKKGYIRLRYDGRQRMQHDWVWEQEYGAIPTGYDVHHINGNKQDNRIENLVAIDRIKHKRIHGNCQMRSGEWWKQCPKCGEWFAIETGYYKCSGGSPLAICKGCHIAEVTGRRNIRIANGWKRPNYSKKAKGIQSGG